MTFEPKRANMDANSTPTAPEPITRSDFGTSVSSSIGRGQDRLVVDLEPGSARGVEPVATMTFFAA